MGFDLSTFTLIHVLLSIPGIFADLVMAGGFISGVRTAHRHGLDGRERISY
jgi:hypothetical protein